MEGAAALVNGLTHNGVVRHFRRAVYFFLCGMLVYLLSWSTILCRVIRGVAQYPDDMPTFVWVTTVGLLLFYETFILAQATSLTTRIRQVLDAQHRLLRGSKTNPDKTVLSEFVTEAGASEQKRDYWYMLFLFTCSLPDWKSIAFLAGGAAIDLISAVLYGVPSIREFFGMPSDQQRAEPWATMAFLLIIWVVVVGLTARWETRRSSAKITPTEQDRLMPKPIDQIPTGFALQRGKPNYEDGAKSDQRAHLVELLDTFAHLSPTAQIASAFVIYCAVGICVFFLWGWLVMSHVEGMSETPWIVILFVLASVLVGMLCYTGKRRMLASNQEVDASILEEDAGSNPEHDAQTLIASFAERHDAAKYFHLGLVAFTVFIGLGASDREWASDYLLLNRDTFFFSQDWQTIKHIRDNPQLEASMLNASTTIGLDSNHKIPVGYCASDATLPIYLIFVCAAWSLCSALQHHCSSQTLSKVFGAADRAGSSTDGSDGTEDQTGSVGQEQPNKLMQFFKNEWVRYLLLVLLVTLVLVWPSFKRRGLSWQGFVVAAIVAGPVILLLQVTIYGVWDLFPNAPQDPPKNDLARAHAAVRRVRNYKWIEYTFSATLMHLVVAYVGGITSAHELVLCAGCLAASMLYSSMSEAEVDAMELGTDVHSTAPPRAQRQPTRLTLKERISCENAFLFLSFWAKSVLCIALTVPWLFVDRGDYVFVPQKCGVSV